MSPRRTSSRAFEWIASLLGRGDRRTDGGGTAASHDFNAGVSVEEVRRASLAVASRSDQEILHESRRLAPLAFEIVQQVGCSLTPGTTTVAISNQLVREATSRGVLPAMLGYHGFPGAAAVSINEELVHGVPSERRILAGDLVKIEFGIVSGVAFAASSWTFAVSAPSAEDAALLECGRTALEKAIETVSPDARMGDVGAAIQAEAERGGLEIVRAFVGYGMGQKRMQPPQVPGVGERGTGAKMRAGWILNLHVILKRGTGEIEIASNGWTAHAADGERGCIFTGMVEVTAKGHRRLSMSGA